MQFNSSLNIYNFSNSRCNYKNFDHQWPILFRFIFYCACYSHWLCVWLMVNDVSSSVSLNDDMFGQMLVAKLNADLLSEN